MAETESKGQEPHTRRVCLTDLDSFNPQLTQVKYSCVRFAVSLHQYHAMPLRAAYVLAVMQFRSLRSEHHIATKVAVAEAEAYGSTFGPTETEKRYKKEEEHLATWETPEEAKQYSLEARKRWKAIIDKGGREGAWTRGAKCCIPRNCHMLILSSITRRGVYSLMEGRCPSGLRTCLDRSC